VPSRGIDSPRKSNEEIEKSLVRETYHARIVDSTYSEEQEKRDNNEKGSPKKVSPHPENLPLGNPHKEGNHENDDRDNKGNNSNKDQEKETNKNKEQ
jgi:hypothetical protein